MKSLLLGLLAETSIHSGAGSSGGLVDLPVAREAATDYPYLAGSSLKGALRQWAADAGLDNDTKAVFGEQESAGGILVSDARLLMLPVRSLDTSYKWITSPHLLERLHRDAARAGLSDMESEVSVKPGEYCGRPVAGDLPLFSRSDSSSTAAARRSTRWRRI
jgi:CRISPR-associated protein Cmr4